MFKVCDNVQIIPLSTTTCPHQGEVVKKYEEKCCDDVGTVFICTMYKVRSKIKCNDCLVEYNNWYCDKDLAPC